jgi:hypothetical protein
MSETLADDGADAVEISDNILTSSTTGLSPSNGEGPESNQPKFGSGGPPLSIEDIEKVELSSSPEISLSDVRHAGSIQRPSTFKFSVQSVVDPESDLPRPISFVYANGDMRAVDVSPANDEDPAHSDSSKLIEDFSLDG